MSPFPHPRNASLKTLKSNCELVKTQVVQWQADADAAKSRSTRTSLNYQDYGEMVQDTVNFDVEKVDPLPCPVYKHMCVMPLESGDLADDKNLSMTNL